MGWVNLESESADLWEYVSLYESFDYISRLYKKFHGNDPDHAKVREINASFEQGRMYFENARTAAIGVKPLLLYYGALALCGGLTLFKNHDTTELSRSRSHGLRPIRWQETLGHGVGDILNLKIRFTDGSFTELTNICWQKNIAAAMSSESRSGGVFQYLQCLGPLKFSRQHEGVTLGELIARSWHSGLYYPSVTGERSRMHPVAVWREKMIHIILNSTREFPSDVLEYYRKQDNVIVDVPSDGPGQLGFEHQSKQVPLFYFDATEASKNYFGMYMVEDFACGSRPNEFIKLYLIAYILGTLSRYYPSKWMSIIRNDENAIARPLLIMAMKAVETKFVREFAQQVAVVSHDMEFFGECRRNFASNQPIDWSKERYFTSGEETFGLLPENQGTLSAKC